jgi:hypothetical protein
MPSGNRTRYECSKSVGVRTAASCRQEQACAQVVAETARSADQEAFPPALPVAFRVLLQAEEAYLRSVPARAQTFALHEKPNLRGRVAMRPDLFFLSSRSASYGHESTSQRNFHRLGGFASFKRSRVRERRCEDISDSLRKNPGFFRSRPTMLITLCTTFARYTLSARMAPRGHAGAKRMPGTSPRRSINQVPNGKGSPCRLHQKCGCWRS